MEELTAWLGYRQRMNKQNSVGSDTAARHQDGEGPERPWPWSPSSCDIWMESSLLRWDQMLSWSRQLVRGSVGALWDGGEVSRPGSPRVGFPAGDPVLPAVA